MSKAQTVLPPHRMERRKVADLVPADYNPRNIDKKALDGLTASVREFGTVQPVIVNERTGNVVGGHQRIKALKALGQEETDVVVVDLDPTREKALNVALNNPATSGEFTRELWPLLDEIKWELPDLFSEIRLDEMKLEGETTHRTGGRDREDFVPPSATRRVEKGDVWKLGRHRLLCGDGMSASDKARVIDGRTYGVTVVDPPYEISDAGYVMHIADPSIVFGIVKVVLLIPSELFRFERVMIRPNHNRNPATRVAMRHALVCQVGSVRACPEDQKLMIDSVVEIGTGEQVVHAEPTFSRTQRHGKPVQLLVDHLTHWTPKWDVVFDPFVGTGTTIIAAERMGRSACAIEIDPERCDVIVARWEKETGDKAEKV